MTPPLLESTALNLLGIDIIRFCSVERGVSFHVSLQRVLNSSLSLKYVFFKEESSLKVKPKIFNLKS